MGGCVYVEKILLGGLIPTSFDHDKAYINDSKNSTIHFWGGSCTLESMEIFGETLIQLTSFPLIMCIT